AQAALAWIASSQREVGEMFRVATERRDAGVGLKADVLRAQVMVAQIDQLSISAAHELILARRQLALAMGRPGDEVDIAGPLSATTLAVLAEDRPLARTDLEALALEMEATDLSYRQSRAAYLPRLGLNVSYAFHDGATPFGSEATAWSVQAGLNWELFDGLRRSNRLARSDAGKRAARARFEERARQVDYLLGQARLQVEETRQHLTVAEKALIAAEEGQRLVLQRYTAGLDDLSTLLATQAALDRARLDLAQATSRHLLALGNVAFQNGTFLQTMVLAQENNP
ncbi:MAG: TolC family protein, partial [Desulfuromonadaceae bacterium]